MAGLSKLDGVNKMLGLIGQSPVSTLEESDPDATDALRVLLRASTEIQQEGWNCNREKGVNFYPDVDGHIQLPASTLRIDADDTTIQVARRGDTLYDLKNHTNIFTAAVLCSTITLLEFDDLTPALKSFIIAKASREFQREARGAQLSDQFAADDVTRAMIQAKQEDSENDDHNWKDTEQMQGILGHRNRNSLD